MFLGLSLAHVDNAIAFYGVLVLFGAARGFSGPAGNSPCSPSWCRRSDWARSIAVNSSVFMVAVIGRTALGGFLYALGPEIFSCVWHTIL